jgi:polysaccharide export outer membrane protein
MNGRFAVTLLLACAQLGTAQNEPNSSAPTVEAKPGAIATSSSYLLGPNDQISLAVDQLDTQFTEKTFRIDQDGNLSVPLIGRIHAGGLTQVELEDEIKNRFGAILKEPDIVVNVTEYSSQPVSVLGAVNTPGIRQLQGGKTLFEVLSLAGGLRPDAGTTVKITRDLRNGPIPVPGAAVSLNNQYSVATVRVKEVMQATEQNLLIRPGDTIFVPKADLVYVVGSVTTPGGFPIGENESLSALQVVALAQGIGRTAAPDKARILRVIPGSVNRSEIAVNLKLLMAGKAPDLPLRPDDILFVPNSNAKSAGYRTLEAIVNAATGIAVYGRY